MATRFLNMGEFEDLKSRIKDYPPEIRSLMAMHESVSLDWCKASAVLDRNGLMTEFRREPKPDWWDD